LFSTLEVIACAAAAALFFTLPGFAIARHVAPALAWPIAPALGLAVQTAATLPIFLLTGFSMPTLAAAALLTVSVSIAALRSLKPGESSVRVPPLAWAAAAVLAIAPMLAILPKGAGDGVILAGPIFDHAKAAIIDEITRSGLPPHNPFFGEPSRLAYYYLWHFAAAELALPLRATGWEADAALTWFTAFASLMLIMGLAVWFSGRPSTALLVPLLCLAASLRPFLLWVFGPELYKYILPNTGFAGWLFQAAWVPQHLTSACCVVLAVVLIGQLAMRPRPLLVAVLALVVAAGFESSTWVGGVTFAIAAPVIGAVVLLLVRPRAPFLLAAAGAAALALVLIAPLARDQFLATAARHGGPALAIEPMNVFEDFISEDVSAIIDLPGYWLILLPIEFAAIYPAGLAALAWLARSRSLGRPERIVMLGLTALIAVSLVVAWLIASTIGENDDLGWRAILPGVLGMTTFAAVGLCCWFRSGARLLAGAAMAMALLALPDGIRLAWEAATGESKPSAASFAATPAMWDAVRRHAGPDDRIANNPLFLDDMTTWPVNISWALLANRRSCYAGKELALAFASLSDDARDAVDAQFVRVFAGEGTAADLRELALRYHCAVVVVTPADGAWKRDPFASSAYYRLVEAEGDRWRIYLTVDARDAYQPTLPSAQSLSSDTSRRLTPASEASAFPRQRAR
jgi:hypothetical protein